MKIKEMMKRKGFAKIAMFVGVATLWLGLLTPSAHALSLAPGDADWTTDVNSFCDLDCIEVVTGLDLSGFTLLYKGDVGSESAPAVVESGSLAGSYETTFSNSPLDPADFLIDYTVGPYASCPTCILVVKDGNQDPAQYLFDLGSWNGQDDIVGTGFWPTQGAISNVAIYGETTSVPEPSSLLLLGSGILSLGVIGRKFAKRKS